MLCEREKGERGRGRGGKEGEEGERGRGRRGREGEEGGGERGGERETLETNGACQEQV